MISFSLRKFLAITEMKFKSTFNKNLIMMPFGSVGITLMLRVLYGIMLKGKPVPEAMMAVALNMGLLMNAAMTGMLVTSAALAAEKEKHTLRTLMTSSVTGLEFFLGSIIPPFVVLVVINAILVPVSGFSFNGSDLVIYFLVTTIASLTSCIIGMLIGVFAKDQMSASTLTSPFMMVFLFIPMFSSFAPGLAKISRFLFTGIISEMVNAFASGETFTLDILNVAVLLGEIILAVFLFILAYRKNGYEAD